MINYIVAGILILIVGFVIYYLVKQKRNGVKCVGCSHSRECGNKSCKCNTKNK